MSITSSVYYSAYKMPPTSLGVAWFPCAARLMTADKLTTNLGLGPHQLRSSGYPKLLLHEPLYSSRVARTSSVACTPMSRGANSQSEFWLRLTVLDLTKIHCSAESYRKRASVGQRFQLNVKRPASRVLWKRWTAWTTKWRLGHVF